MSGFAISPAASDDDLTAVVDVRSAVDDRGVDLHVIGHSRQAMSGEYLLARIGTRAVGCAGSFVFPGTADAPHLWADVAVVAGYRRRGIGGELLRAVSTRARTLGKEGLQLEVREHDVESIAFVERRGYVELEREHEVVLDLSALLQPPPVDPPPEVTIVSRAERPDLERQMFEVDREASLDIPGLASSIEQTFEEWRTFAIERPSRDPELTFLALAGDRVVGLAYLDVVGGTAYHGLTGVTRDWRGRGVATALKHAQIAAARSRGFTRLVTESQQDNVPMRRLNEQLGYLPGEATIVFQGPLLG